MENTLDKGSYIDGLASELLLSRTPSDEVPEGMPRDDQWVKQSFIISIEEKTKTNLSPTDIANRRFSSASWKYTDSSLGGNTCINPPPQFTRYADIRDKGIRPDSKDTSIGLQAGNIGMGRYYSEAIDDNNQVIHLRFGVAQFTSFTQFFTGFYSSDAGAAARQGRFTSGFINGFLKFGGVVLSAALAPLAIIPVAILMFGSMIRYFMNIPSSKFYTLKPSMPMYWSAVSSMLNQIGSNQGIISYMNDKDKANVVGQEHNFGQAEKSILSALMPLEFTPKGTIDIHAVANKAKRLEMQYDYMRVKMFEDSEADSDNNENFFGVIKDSLSPNRIARARHPNASASVGIEAYLARFLSDGKDLSTISDDENKVGVEKDIRTAKEKTPEQLANDAVLTYEPETKVGGFLNYFTSNLADGAEWASFRVDYTGPVSESFSNSVTESSLAQKINGMSSANRDIRMNYGGLAGSVPMMETVVGAVQTILGSVASTLHVEGLAAAAGSAFVDIPKHWESSSSQLPKATYTMTLISPYGNPISQMFSLYVPLCMLLAGALPLSTGKQSHTSPFLVELHDRGRCMTRLGIIDSLSITRGTSNLGFNNEGQPMAVDVSFSVLDLSSVMSMPILPGIGSQLLSGLFDSENAFSDYLMALSGMKLGDTIYRMPMLKYQVRRKLADLNTITSASSIASWAASLPGVNQINSIMKGIGTSKR